MLFKLKKHLSSLTLSSSFDCHSIAVKNSSIVSLESRFLLETVLDVKHRRNSDNYEFLFSALAGLNLRDFRCNLAMHHVNFNTKEVVKASFAGAKNFRSQFMILGILLCTT